MANSYITLENSIFKSISYTVEVWTGNSFHRENGQFFFVFVYVV